MRAGFIGLGNIGAPIARNLIAPDVELTVLDAVKAAEADLLASGARSAATPADLAAAADIIGVCVRDDVDVRSVMEGPSGILTAARPGLIVAIHSTIDVSTIRELAERAARLGVHVIDAPVTRGGAAHGARNYIFMLAGDPSALELSRPYFKLVALKVVEFGPVGAGMAAKLCNNFLTYLNVLAVSEIAAVAVPAELDLAALSEVLATNGVGNAHVLSMLKQRAGQAVTIGDGKPLPSNSEAAILARKDLGSLMALAGEAGLKMPLVETTRTNFGSMIRDQTR